MTQMQADFSGRNAFVTGAGGGMGLQIARDLIGAGAQATLLDVKPAPDDLPAGARYVQVDLRSASDVAQAMADCCEAAGRLDYLVNAAGVLLLGRDRSLVDIDLDVWDDVLAINLKGAALTARHAIPLMKRTGGGAMVHVSTIQCVRGDDAPQDAYQASKAGLIAMAKSIAIQFAGDGIRSNTILPGPTMTPMQQRWVERPELKDATEAAVPLGRVGTTQDMANATLFLLSDAASFITGTELIVDGGVLAKP
ncbi:MAG: SDR family NAD(P)-dependent oxidoreductase [Rhodospirillaceae bacterium]|nr:SDR family NAD(P)-dependent oxidoreductase [Rhodospirillaceae bacterium]